MNPPAKDAGPDGPVLLLVLSLSLALVLMGLISGGCRNQDMSESSAHDDGARARLIVLGVDGMDPVLTRRFMAEGRLPHLTALAREGSFLELETSIPPQSPVAWSHIISGAGSSQHGIYDFVHRDPATLRPYLSTAAPGPAPPALELFGRRLPLGGSEMRLLRVGEPFWAPLAAAGIATSVTRIPAHFPPSDDGQAQTLAGMGTPDLLGTYGTYQLFTDDPVQAARSLPAGIGHRLVWQPSGVAQAALTGPANPLRSDAAPLSLPVTVAPNATRTAAVITIGSGSMVLRPGEWSLWQPVAFDPGALGPELPGMIRWYLISLTPRIFVYASPINIDPTNPAMPLSWPRDWSAELAAEVGRFYTQGMPEETKALEAGVLSDEDFLAQSSLIFAEEQRLLDHALARQQQGLVFHYFSVVDQLSHVYWRSLDPTAAPALARHAKVLPRLYSRIDEALGKVRREAGPQAAVLLLSDHGFAPYDWSVNVNTWLLRQGYLTLRHPAGSGPLGHIDWARTQAYALGLNQVFLNLRGREAEGVVGHAEAPQLLDRLARRLESWLDPRSGARVVSRTFRPPAGEHTQRAPDLVVGFARGYRSSDRSATGLVEEQAVFANSARWSGDHCIDPALVPGVLFSSRKLRSAQAALIDVAPTILQFFGVPARPHMQGRSLW
jgi:predicted AlkP superfamily phosphohydrolase/phosphomutase